MGADLRALFEHRDIDLVIMLQAELLEPDRRRQTGRPGADDDDVIFHRFPAHDAFPPLLMSFSYAAIAPPGQLLPVRLPIC